MYKLLEISKKITEEKSTAFLYTSSYFDDNAVSYLFHKPAEIISVSSQINLDKKLLQLDEMIEKEYIILSLINYEAGYLFEERLNSFTSQNNELMKFFCFKKNEIEIIPSKDIKLDKFEQDFAVTNFIINETKQEYINKIKKIKNYIKEGETYQVNYTVKANFNFSGNINSFFQNLIFNQSTQYSALINNGGKLIFSISPELFFSTENNLIKSRPMKGTIKRGFNSENDLLKKEELRNSNKDKAENVMIVDLLRNDIGKISKLNSVEVKSIYSIEKYESIYQLTSAVSGELNAVKYSEIIKNLFPCGSITGAPKLRTMKIIKELEKEDRGIYTGAIGLINKSNSVFNVAIRTIIFDKENCKGEIGLGSGIVWDSIPEEEYEEVKLKGNFLLKPDQHFELFETMLYENGKIFLINEHLNRLKESAEFFLFKYGEIEIFNLLELHTAELSKKEKYKLRLVLKKDGTINCISEIEKPIKSSRIIISKNRINSKNKFQYFKTTNRELYDREFNLYKKNNFFDVIYFNEKDELAEGAITNIFIYSNDKWKTPSLNCGILNGTYRAKFILDNNVSEEKILRNDLLNAERVVLTNSVKKEVEINETYENGKLVWLKK